MADPSNAGIRVSDTERDEAVSTLGVHLSTGRLELSEYEERCGQVVSARRRGELEALFSDLPAPHPDLSSATPPAQLIQKAGQLVRGPTGGGQRGLLPTRASMVLDFVAGMTAVLGIPAAILLTIFLGQWWWFIPVGVVLIVAGGLAENAKKPPPAA